MERKSVTMGLLSLVLAVILTPDEIFDVVEACKAQAEKESPALSAADKKAFTSKCLIGVSTAPVLQNVKKACEAQAEKESPALSAADKKAFVAKCLVGTLTAQGGT